MTAGRGPAADLPVELPAEHPGTADPHYLAHRTAIAAAARGFVRGRPVPTVSYTEQDLAVWRSVRDRLAVAHRSAAATVFLDAAEELALPADRIPQLDEVSARLAGLTRFRLEPAVGLVPVVSFCGSLADSYFQSTQYMRHHSTPFYSPEPDVLHELVGHGTALANDRLARLYRLVGQAIRRMSSEETIQFIAKTFWFTMECGVLKEHGEVRCYGASLMSSYGELEHFRTAEVRALDIAALAEATYEITDYQQVLYAAESLGHLEDVVGSFWETCDEDTVRAVLHAADGKGTPA